MIERKSQSLTIGKKWKIQVWEANWSMSGIPERIEKEAQQLRSSLNGSGDRALLDFHEMVYPWLFAYSTGNVPTLEEAYKLPDKELDRWYDAVRHTNPDMFPDIIPADTTVTFRDGTTFTIRSTKYPSVLRRSYQLASVAYSYLAEHPEDVSEFARQQVYGKLACCSFGDTPDYADLQDWPATELQKWYSAVLLHNPQLFLSSEETQASAEQQVAADQAKKKLPPKLSSNS
jgi:hypothetical protein